MIKSLVKTYFEAFSNKDLQGLEKLFSEEIVLKDWEVFAEGKEKVLKANKNIFDLVDRISADLQELYLDDLVAICLIEIIINNDERLKVVDIIKFFVESLLTLSIYNLCRCVRLSWEQHKTKHNSDAKVTVKRKNERTDIALKELRKDDIIVLNKEYTGGDLQIKINNKEKSINLKVGECVSFPSKLLHTVNRINTGIRYSLVGWEHGE